MKLYSVIYSAGCYKGDALIAAKSVDRVGIVLSQYGALNSENYNIHWIDEVGCSDKPEGILSDSFGTQSPIVDSFNSQIINTSKNNSSTEKKFSIDSLTPKDINDLKKKLNIQNYTLKVDRIGSINRHSSINGKTPHNGYTVFVTDINNGAKSYTGVTPELGHVYTVIDGEYVDLSKPDSSILKVESAKKIVDMNGWYNCLATKKEYKDGIPAVIIKEDFSAPKYGIFFRKNIFPRFSLRPLRVNIKNEYLQDKAYWKAAVGKYLKENPDLVKKPKIYSTANLVSRFRCVVGTLSKNGRLKKEILSFNYRLPEEYQDHDPGQLL